MKTKKQKGEKVLQVTVSERLSNKHITSKSFPVYDYGCFTDAFLRIKKAIEEL